MRPSFVMWDMANTVRCKFPNWQNSRTIHFLPHFIASYFFKKKSRKYLALLGSCALGPSDSFLILLSSDPRKPVLGKVPGKEKCLHSSLSPSASARAVWSQPTLSAVQQQQSPDKTASHSPLFRKRCPDSAQEQNREVMPSIPSDKCRGTLGMSLFSSNNARDQTQGLSQVRQELYHCTARPVLDFCFQMSCLSLPFANKPTFCVVLQEESKKDQEDRSGF